MGATLPDRPALYTLVVSNPGNVRSTFTLETDASELPGESVIWFVVDRNGEVVRTGVERGADREVEARIRARHPDETASHAMLTFTEVPAAGEVTVLWLLPEP